MKRGPWDFWNARRNTNLYVIVGAVPQVDYLSPPWLNVPRGRYFGSNRFEETQSDEQAVNFPLAVWTAACLVDLRAGGSGYYTVFWNWNDLQNLNNECFSPGRDSRHFLGYRGSGTMNIKHSGFGWDFDDKVHLFPGEPKCQNGIYKDLYEFEWDETNRHYRFV